MDICKAKGGQVIVGETERGPAKYAGIFLNPATFLQGSVGVKLLYHCCPIHSNWIQQGSDLGRCACLGSAADTAPQSAAAAPASALAPLPPSPAHPTRAHPSARPSAGAPCASCPPAKPHNQPDSSMHNKGADTASGVNLQARLYGKTLGVWEMLAIVSSLFCASMEQDDRRCQRAFPTPGNGGSPAP